MRLLICRHAEAIDADESMTDEERWLTKHGRQQARDVGRALQKHGIQPDTLFSSSLVRAVQTADLLAEALQSKRPVQILRPLAPGGRLSSVIQALAQCESSETVAIVGHEPQMSEWTAKLLGRPHLDRPFKKGAVCCLEWKEWPELGTGQGVFFITPKELSFDRI